MYENLNNFTKGQDPKAAMQIGRRTEIIKWFNDLCDLEIAPSNYKIDDNLNITVEENLNLSYTNITELPDNLTVEGDLDIGHTNIIELPNHLIVYDDLYMYDAKITELPKDLTVKGKIVGFKK